MVGYAMRNKSKSEQTADASKYPQGYFKEKPCRWCGKCFTPNAPSELYCCDDCKDIALTNAYLKRTYGIGIPEYNKMYEDQKGLCAICGGEGFVMDKNKHKAKLAVDHCHETGEVRGLLCHNCNRGLGLFRDSVYCLENAITYLKVQRLSERSTPEADAGGSAESQTGNAEGSDIVCSA